MAVKQRYGMNADGSVTRCRAKPGNVGRYGCTHGRHEDLTDEQAMEINERAAAATSPATGSSLTKSARIDQNGVEADVMREMYGGGDSELANRRMRESAVRDILDGALYVEPGRDIKAEMLDPNNPITEEQRTRAAILREILGDPDVSDEADHVLNRFHDLTDGAVYERGLNDDGDNDLVLDAMVFDPDGPMGSGNDYIEQDVRAGIGDRTIHVADRAALAAVVRDGIVRTAGDPGRELDKRGMMPMTNDERSLRDHLESQGL